MSTTPPLKAASFACWLSCLLSLGNPSPLIVLCCDTDSFLLQGIFTCFPQVKKQQYDVILAVLGNRHSKKGKHKKSGTVGLTGLTTSPEVPVFYSWLCHCLLLLWTSKLTLFCDCSTIYKMGMIMLSTTKGQCNSLLINIYKVPGSSLLCTFAVTYVCTKWRQSGWKLMLYFIPTLCQCEGLYKDYRNGESVSSNFRDAFACRHRPNSRVNVPITYIFTIPLLSIWHTKCCCGVS